MYADANTTLLANTTYAANFCEHIEIGQYVSRVDQNFMPIGRQANTRMMTFENGGSKFCFERIDMPAQR